MEGKIITVWSSRGNVGTSTVAIGLAKELSDINNKTILVDLNLLQPRISYLLGLEIDNHSIDVLYPYSMSKENLTEEIIKANCDVLNDNLLVLKGTNNPSNLYGQKYINIEILNSILNILKNNFDYIVLDVHHTITNVGTYIALNRADIIYTILDKKALTIMSFRDVKEWLFNNFDRDKFKIVINQNEKKSVLSISDIENYINMPVNYFLPNVKGFDEAINSTKFKDSCKNRVFKNYYKELRNIAKTIKEV